MHATANVISGTQASLIFFSFDSSQMASVPWPTNATWQTTSHGIKLLRKTATPYINPCQEATANTMHGTQRLIYQNVWTRCCLALEQRSCCLEFLVHLCSGPLGAVEQEGKIITSRIEDGRHRFSGPTWPFWELRGGDPWLPGRYCKAGCQTTSRLEGRDWPSAPPSLHAYADYMEWKSS